MVSPNSRFWSNVDKTPGQGPNGECWLWTASQTSGGYGLFNTRLTHRLAYEITYGLIPEGSGYHGTVVRHMCDVRLGCRPDHLELGTQAENNQDAARRGHTARGAAHRAKIREVAARGEQHGSAKLTEAEVRTIRARVALGEPKNALAREYGVDPACVRALAARRTWKHVD